MISGKNKNNYDFFTYPNGLRLITVPMDSTKTVTVLVLVATGSRYENKEINGISHFLEHMMFKGTTKRPNVMDITRELDSIGAEYNAFTSKEYTGYYVKCAAEKADLAMDVISDIFQNSKFDEKEIEKEKGVIVEEINMYQDTPARYVGDLYEKLLYGEQPLGFLTQGEKEIIKNLKRDDFVNYFTTHYFDKNTVIVVAGDINSDEIKKKVEKYFSNTRDSKLITPVKTVENQKEPELSIFNKKTDQSHFIIGFRTLDYFDKRREVFDAASLVLSAGLSSRLFQEFRTKRGLAYYVHASTSSYADVGYFEIAAGVDNARLVEALEVSIGEFKKLVDGPVSDEELKKVKDYARGRTVIGLESSDDWASFYADQELLKRKIETVEEKLAHLDRVTAEDIQRVAKEFFVPKNLNLALIGPFEEDNPEIKKVLNSW